VPRRKPSQPIVLLTDQQAADQLHVSVKWVRRRRYSGELATVVVGGLRRIPASSVDDYIRRNTTGGVA
jgi:excisionase family DNA binding protein